MLLITTFYPSGYIASGLPPPSFHPDTSHPEFLHLHFTRTYRIRIPLPANIPPEHIASGFLFPPTFHPDISHPESFPAPFHPDTSHPEFLRRHFTRTYRIRNFSSRRHSIRTYRIRISSSRQHSTPDISHLEFSSANIPSGYLTPGILSADVSSSPDTSHQEFFSADIPPSPDISHSESHFVNSFKSRYTSIPILVFLYACFVSHMCMIVPDIYCFPN
uniref:Uncharacterized protein n=1 Tax=Vitis vinifera TaxID=29760 RepID=A5B6D7_VITVI|nr:hypothetical protein VITISV_006828 [Vitis vinifera]